MQPKYTDTDVTRFAEILGHAVDEQSYGRYEKAYGPEDLRLAIEIIGYGDAVCS